jgi:putative addiction module component (TIGR02574 family)
MTRQQLLDEAMALSAEDRERLAEDLWQSLDDSTRDEIDAAWTAEIRRRIEAIGQGEPLLDGEQVMAELRKRLGNEVFLSGRGTE